MDTTLVGGFLTAMESAYTALVPYAKHLLYILVAFNVLFIGINIIIGKINSIMEIVWRFCIIATIIYIVEHWQPIVTVFSNSVFNLAGMNTKNASSNMGSTIIHDPGSILSYAYHQLIDPILGALDKRFADNGVLKGLAMYKFMLQYGLVIIVLLACFIVIMLQVVLALISFHVCLFFSLMMLPFLVFEPFAFLGKNAFTSMVGCTLTLGVLIFICNIGFGMFQTYFVAAITSSLSSFNIGTIISALAASIIFAYMCIVGPTLVMTLVSGAPMLGAAGFASTVSNIGKGVSKIAGGANKLMHPQPPKTPSPSAPSPSGNTPPSPTPPAALPAPPSGRQFQGSLNAGQSPAAKQLRASSGTSFQNTASSTGTSARLQRQLRINAKNKGE
jgi:hypothetical protein